MPPLQRKEKRQVCVIIVVATILVLVSAKPTLAQEISPDRSSPKNQDLPAKPLTLPTLEQSRANLKTAQEEYLCILQEREQILQKAYDAGRIELGEAVRLASRDVLTAELELASKPEDRVAILQKLVQVAKELEQVAEDARLRPPRLGETTEHCLVRPGNLYTRKAERLKAEMALYRELIKLQSEER